MQRHDRGGGLGAGGAGVVDHDVAELAGGDELGEPVPQRTGQPAGPDPDRLGAGLLVALPAERGEHLDDLRVARGQAVDPAGRQRRVDQLEQLVGRLVDEVAVTVRAGDHRLSAADLVDRQRLGQCRRFHRFPRAGRLKWRSRSGRGCGAGGPTPHPRRRDGSAAAEAALHSRVRRSRQIYSAKNPCQNYCERRLFEYGHSERIFSLDAHRW